MTDADKIRGLRDAQGQNLTDAYMRGLYNGLELALCVIEDREPRYVSPAQAAVSVRAPVPAPINEPALPRYALNSDNGLMYESARGPWVRYVDCTAPAPAPSAESVYRDIQDQTGWTSEPSK